MVKCKRKSGPAPKDILGQRFGRLVSLCYVSSGKWECRCDCGRLTISHGADLRRGKVQSCGCLSLEHAVSGDNRRTHGMSESPEYKTWTGMIRRCTDPVAQGYYRYGGRGISVCDRWLKSFEYFFIDMGFRPKGHTLDRYPNNDGNYDVTNCRWATRLQQAENTSTAIMISANGKTMCLEAWSRELGVSANALGYRNRIGLSHHDIINKPFRKHVSW